MPKPARCCSSRPRGLPIDPAASGAIVDSLRDIVRRAAVGVWAYGVRHGHVCPGYVALLRAARTPPRPRPDIRPTSATRWFVAPGVRELALLFVTAIRAPRRAASLCFVGFAAVRAPARASSAHVPLVRSRGEPERIVSMCGLTLDHAGRRTPPTTHRDCAIGWANSSPPWTALRTGQAVTAPSYYSLMRVEVAVRSILAVRADHQIVEGGFAAHETR